MDRNSNAYTIAYAGVLTVVVAAVLALMSMSLKGLHDRNEAMATKKAILAAVGKEDVEDAETFYNENVSSVVLKYGGEVVNDTAVKAEKIKIADQAKKAPEDRYYPLFVFNEGSAKSYIVPLYGNGLWDKIWGYVALKDDFNTIEGVSFDHKAETPGLGAEITDNAAIPASFIGKKIFDGEEYVSVEMVKGGVKNPDHQVDAISGATITSNGVNEMLYEDIQDYLSYFNKLQSK